MKLIFLIYLFARQAEEAAGPGWTGIEAMGHSQAGISSEAAEWASGKQDPASRQSIAPNSSFLNCVKNSLHYGGIFKENNYGKFGNIFVTSTYNTGICRIDDKPYHGTDTNDMILFNMAFIFCLLYLVLLLSSHLSSYFRKKKKSNYSKHAGLNQK